MNVSSIAPLSLPVLLIASALALTSPQTQAKTYKWTDAEGNVHYTQTPPPATAQESKSLKVRGGGSVKVRKRGKKLYCGKKQLPRLRGRAATDIANLENNIISWEDNIERTREQRTEYIKSNSRRATSSRFSKRLRDYDRRIDEHQCQIKWAKAELDKLEGDRSSIVKHEKDLQGMLTDLEQRKVSACGSDNRSGIVRVDDTYREYKRCIAPWDREIRKVKRSLKQAKREARMVTE